MTQTPRRPNGGHREIVDESQVLFFAKGKETRPNSKRHAWVLDPVQKMPVPKCGTHNGYGDPITPHKVRYAHRTRRLCRPCDMEVARPVPAPAITAAPVAASI